MAYAWTPHDSWPGVSRRATLSSESLWVSRPRDAREIFVSGEVTVSAAGTAEARDVEAAARRAWRRLRFEVPELGVEGGEEDGETAMRYVNPRVEDVEAWVQRSLFFSHGTRALDFAGLKRGVLLRKGESEDPVVLLLHFHPARVGAEDGRRLSIMMNTDHLVTDGVGTRILFGKFLGVFAKYLSSSNEGKEGGKGDGKVSVAEEDFEWRESWRNLSPPWINILSTAPDLSVKKVEETVAYHRDIFMNKMSSNPGLPLKPPPTEASPSLCPPIIPPSSTPQPEIPQASNQKSLFHTFTTSKTAALLTAIKRQISPQATITHLVHAALVLALLSHDSQTPPPTTPTQEETFYSSCWLSGRRYLQDQEGKRGGHVPVCMGFHPIVFEGLGRLRGELGACETAGARRRVLVETCKVAMNEYRKLESRNHVLVDFCQLSDLLLSKPPTRDHEARPPDTRKAAPLFLSDGRTESYISRTYPPATTSASSPSPTSSIPTIEVKDVYFAANADGEVVLRLCTFRDRLRLSAEWRSELFEAEMVRGFVRWMVELLTQGDSCVEI
ncbi:hypothetical protein BJ875DRAFT_244575 [Amylocarpus encephaloides]|uniref:Condensation domain-containing protein n=1 Tax=Amylocarpus encephaloides TaxID=45428 RepID=A0A9P7YSX2_9HELO|nr:hypothetical protein BJ875DRAFT_244575 [Amylocarpus encephaloides]